MISLGITYPLFRQGKFVTIAIFQFYKIKQYLQVNTRSPIK